MLKQKNKSKKYSFKYLAAIAILVFGLASSIFYDNLAQADSISQQIEALRQENAEYNKKVLNLQDQATSYEDAIRKLAAQINFVQSEIQKNEAEKADLEKQIDKAQIELEHQKEVLGQNIKAMYLEGDTSTLEILASSNDLSDFVNREEYRNSVQDQVTTTMAKIKDLKQKLEKQQQRLADLIKTQKEKYAQLASAQAQQNELLSYNKSQQAAYSQKTKKNQKKIDELIAAQRRANFNPDGGYYFIRFSGAVRDFNPGAYPYRNAGFGMSPGPGCVDNDGPDRWGYCTRQCVSYAAWAVEASGRDAPMYWGNARDWVAAAYSRGISVYRTPQPGDVAISTSGYWGHAMYVESVSGNSFTTSEYNSYLDGRLHYLTRNY